VEKFQKIYQYSIKIDDTVVDKLLIMWKTGGGINFDVEKCGKGIVLSLFCRTFQQYVGIMWKKLFFYFFISSINNVENQWSVGQ